MSDPGAKRQTFKKKIVHEMVEYWLNFTYLTLAFAAFTQYRRLVLAAHDITYTNYWFAVIEAAILAKVIMIGDVVRLGRGLEDKPLIYPTLYKTLVFTLLVAIFKIVEDVIKSLWRGDSILHGLANFSDKEFRIVLANTLIVLVAFIPFFAVKEIGRVLGEGKLWALFFRRKNTPSGDCLLTNER
jgi:hypothetical protein